MSENTTEYHVVVVGDIFTGIELRGPFTDFDKALDWAEYNIADSADWHVITVEPADD